MDDAVNDLRYLHQTKRLYTNMYQRNIMFHLFRTLLLLVAVTLLTGCSSAKTKGLLSRIMRPASLRVAIAIDSPPLAYKKDGVIIWAGG